MKIRMKTIYAGPLGSHLPGDEIDVAPEEAKALCPRYADSVDEPVPEASPPAPEKTEQEQSMVADVEIKPAAAAREYKCKECGEVFASPRGLSVHKQTHDQEE